MIKYIVSCPDANIESIAWEDDNGFSALDDVQSPWTYSFTVSSSGFWLYLDTNTAEVDQKLTAAIYIDDEIYCHASGQFFQTSTHISFWEPVWKLLDGEECETSWMP